MVFFLNTGCASTDNTDFQEERKKKLDQLNEDCDFATVEFGFPEDIYVCYKSPTNIKSADFTHATGLRPRPSRKSSRRSLPIIKHFLPSR